MSKEIDWAALSAPFAPDEVSFRVQSTYERDGKTHAVVVAYIDARNVADRLDAECGPDGWSFDWEPVVTGATKKGVNAVLAAKGTLTIAGISKSDVGDAGDTEPTKASVSDALKRAAVLWGIGRYLYDLPFMTATPEKRGQSWVLPRAEEQRLRAAYLSGKTAPHRAPQPNPATRPKHAPASTSTTPAASSGHGTQDTPSTDPMALTHASAQDQRKFVEALRTAGYTKQPAVEALLLHVTGRAIPAADLLREASDISYAELAKAHQYLTRVPASANGKGAR